MEERNWFIERLTKEDKYKWFVQHIENHKDIDIIANERIEIIIINVSPELFDKYKK